jgi:aryl-alcohol dehydrogenase-like predicted oxidoreductase
MLRTRRLGGTGMEISRVGLGTWAIGGGEWAFGWGPQDDGDSVDAIARALELGVNWIDTAAVYGLGHAETIVGRAIRGVRPRPYLFTKTGRVSDGRGGIASRLTRDSVLREAEASLRRLGVDAIDLYQVHWPDPVDEVDEGWAAFAELKEQGVVRHIGVCNFDPAQLRRVQRLAPVETLQSPYSLIARGVEAETLPLAVREGIGVIVYSPMGSGLLTGTMTPERIAGLPDNDWRKHDDDFREPRLTGNLAAAAKIARVAGRLGVAPGAAAVAWTLRNPAVTAAIVGFRRAGQVPAILAAAAGDLDDLDLDGPDLDLHRGGAGC